jgi:hypothetical protein
VRTKKPYGCSDARKIRSGLHRERMRFKGLNIDRRLTFLRDNVSENVSTLNFRGNWGAGGELVRTLTSKPWF